MIAGTSREKINADQEFIGQGLANLTSSFFQCFAGSGSFTRSAINYYSGAATRFSGVFSGIIIAIILIFVSPFAGYIPLPSLAGVIMVIAYNMVNKNEIKKVFRISRSDSIVMLVTFGATVLMPDLDWAIYTGIIISIALYLRDTNTVPIKILIPSKENGHNFVEKEIKSIKDKTDILIIQVEGNLYFGSAYDLEKKLEMLYDKAKVFIIRMKRVATIDVTALEALNVFIRTVKESGNDIIICGLSSGLNSMLINSNLLDEIGRENVFLSEEEIFASSTKALCRAQELLNKQTLSIK